MNVQLYRLDSYSYQNQLHTYTIYSLAVAIDSTNVDGPSFEMSWVDADNATQQTGLIFVQLRRFQQLNTNIDQFLVTFCILYLCILSNMVCSTFTSCVDIKCHYLYKHWPIQRSFINQNNSKTILCFTSNSCICNCIYIVSMYCRIR